MKQTKKLPIKWLLLLIGLVPLLFMSIVLTVYSCIKLSNEVRDETFNKLEVAAENVSTYFNYDLVVFGGMNYDDYADHSFIESAKKLDIEMTLFEKNVRFMTSLKKEDGTYNEGTKAGAGIWETVSKGNKYTSDDTVISGKAYYVCYVPVYDKDGSVWGMGFAGTPQEGVEKLTTSMRNSIIIMTVVITAVIALAIIYMSRKIYQSLNSSVIALSELATGSLTVNTTNNSVITEVQEIFNSTDNLKEQLIESAGSAKGMALDLKQAVHSVDDLAQKSSDESNSISQSMNELSVTAQSLADTVQNTNAYVIDMGEAITSITDKAQGSAADAENMRTVNKQVVEVITNVKNSNTRSVEAIRQIGILTSECKQAVETIRTAAAEITDIAGQTNLLALNASIESARAGEAGRGFSVVAENIKELAAKSADSSAGISKRVNEIIARVDKCVEASTAAATVMEEQEKLVVEAGESMDRLSDSVGSVADNIATITGEAERLDQAKDKVLGNISDLSAISEENAASTEQVSTSLAEVSTAIEGVRMEADKMRELAGSLGEKMEFFKL